MAGVQEASEKQTTPEAQQKLLNELDQLRDLVNSLSTASRKEDFVSITLYMFFHMARVQKASEKQTNPEVQQ